MSTRTFHPLAERILDGEKVPWAEIHEFNATRIMARVRHWQERGPHPAKDCKVKNCTHGGGLDVDIAYAAWHTSRATAARNGEQCCPNHT